MIRTSQRTLVLLSILATAQIGLADTLSLCPPLPEARLSTLPLSSEETRIRANQVSGSIDDTLQFLGNVELENASQWIAADKVTVTAEPRYVIAQDNLKAGSDGLLVSGETARFDQQEDRISFDNVRYQFPQKRLFGRAERIEQKGQRITMRKASYTTCPSDDPVWYLQAGKIDLNQETDIGTVRNATLRFADTSVFYLPWATFPLSDQRKSGLLYPHIATTDSSGLEMGIPIYWNFRPNIDDTLVPTWIEKRGLMWDNELRFLFGETEGLVRGKFINNDNLTQTDRHLLLTHLRSHMSDHWWLSADATKVSDNSWFDDFSNDLNLTSLSHLSRRLDLDYHARHTHFQARVLDYQTINTDIAREDYPYRQWPRLSLDSRLPLTSRKLDLALSSELVRFEHDNRQSGNRLNINPRIAFSWRTPSSYLTPRLQWHFTQYELDAGDDFPRTSINREVPTVSIDSGLFFERRTHSGDTQTLEPRLFYVKTPFRDQQDLPVFDTSDSSFNFYSLFRENHFNGIDRIADANQLTVAATTRKVERETGHVPWKASLGQRFHLEDRRVQLPDVPTSASSTSPYAAEIGYDPTGPWSGNASLLFDNQWDSADALTVLGRYRGTNGRIFNLEYRYRANDDIEQSNVSFVWPIHRRWRVMGRWLRAVQDARDIETIFGIEYDNCCWKTQIVSRRYALADEGEYNTGIYLQLILKGLSSQGSATDLLRTSISGYQPIDE